MPELASALVIDFFNLSRQAIDDQHVSALAEVLQAGRALPRCGRAWDPAHGRRYASHPCPLGRAWPDANVWGQLRDYASTAELLRAAVRLNWTRQAVEQLRCGPYFGPRGRAMPKADGRGARPGPAADHRQTVGAADAQDGAGPHGWPAPDSSGLVHLAGRQLTECQEPAICISVRTKPAV